MHDIGLRDGRGDACSSNVWLVGEATRGIRWRNFEQEAPDLAENVRGLIETFRFALLGTIRRDGTPRISPVETHLVRDDLMLVMIPQTRKVADIRRDRRLVLQSPIANPGSPGTEFKLRGVGAPEDEEEQRRAAADAIESFSGWRALLGNVAVRGLSTLREGLLLASFMAWQED